MIRAFIFDLCDTLVHTAGIAKLEEVPGIAGLHALHFTDTGALRREVEVLTGGPCRF